MLASAARAVATAGGTTVIVTSDRDAFALIGAGTHVLRIINGGVECSPLITAERLVCCSACGPINTRTSPRYAVIRLTTCPEYAGSSQDRRPDPRRVGLRGNCLRRAEEVAAFRGVVRGATAPGARRRAIWDSNRQVMAMRDDVPIDVAALPSLPLPLASVRATFAAMQLRWTTAEALRVLCGEPGSVTDERRQAWTTCHPTSSAGHRAQVRSCAARCARLSPPTSSRCSTEPASGRPWPCSDCPTCFTL